MIAVDTNLLVYAHREDSPWHEAAYARLAELAEARAPWAIPWPCIYEFLRLVMHPRVYHPPLPSQVALQDLKAILASPSLVLLSETAVHATILDEVVKQSGVAGDLMHDAHIVALCREHGASELLTGDRDFTRFTGLKITNPFTA